MHRFLISCFCCGLFAATLSTAFADDPDLYGLDQSNPWYPTVDFPALKTPQWVDEDGVECVVVLAIDDMRDSAKYEQYLRPILNRLKQIDGRAPVSIMSCAVKPDDPQLQSWLEEGLSIEVHTVDHPCPILNSGDLPKARSTYERCVDLMSQIPGNRPVAFRTPCCDSLNTVSPRFFDAIFNRTTADGHALQIDSSVFNFYSSADPSIPRELVLDEAGNERFLKYMVKNNQAGGLVHNQFVNYIVNYPYPYVINRSCWQFPCIAPSDWSAQHLQGPNHPKTVNDWKAALDITVLKQGVFNLVFHPHGWINAEQVVELIDHAIQQHGRKVKFLTFREAAARLNRTQTGGRPLREAAAEAVDRASHDQLRRDRPGRGDLRSLPPSVVEQLQRSSDDDTPPLRRTDGTHNGAFIFADSVCWQNEDTNQMPDLIRKVSLKDLTASATQRQQLRDLPLIPIGAATVDITPDYPVRLTGYGNRSSESEGVAAAIHARALVMGGEWADDGNTFTDQPLTALVTVDNCGVPTEVVEAAFRKIAAEHNLPRNRFAVCSTHTHSGPWLRGFAPNVLLDLPEEHAAHLQQYEEELVDRIAQTVLQAIRERRPGSLSRANGKLTFAMNRRVVADGNYRGFGETPDGPVDHQFPLLTARDAKGDLIAVLANYACHATTETGSFNQMSGDWPGFAADYIETEYPGTTALIAIGCGADANPSPRGTHEQAQQHGRSVADEVQRLFAADNFEPLDPRVRCRLARVDLPLGPVPSRAELMQTAAGSHHAAALAKTLLQQLDAGQTLPTAVPDYPVQTWTFGDSLAMVFLGGEVVVDYSLRLNNMLDDRRLWINAYSNDVPCYIASKRILREGGYEADSSMVYYAQPTRLAPEAEDVVCDTVQRLLPHEFYSDELQETFPAPKAPEESRQCISVPGDLEVQLVAAEPLITDPVAFDWDLQGRLYVVEMGGYPNGEGDAAAHEGGRVRLLTDVDGDGRYDKAVTFLDQLAFPTGVCRWRNGILLTDAPHILYAEDTNADGVADVRKVLFSGFAEGNQQHRVNGLRLGLDNWVHIGNGDSGGQITVMAALQNKQVQQDTERRFWWPGVVQVGDSGSISGRDARLRPDEGLLDPTFGRTQFGRERDDHGNWFGNNNSNPLWQYIGEDRWYRGQPVNPHRIRHNVPAVPGAAPVFPTSKTLARFNDFDRANRFTSACSTMIYRDDWLGTEFYGNAFVCEPVHNLVSRLVLQQDGLTFRGQRAAAEAKSEFFASRDNWTRPSMVRTGPDGGLWVADMYRQVIEHPQWIPAEWQRKLNVRAGSDRGRIYRVVPRGSTLAASTNRSTSASKVAGGSPMIDEANTTVAGSAPDSAACCGATEVAADTPVDSQRTFFRDDWQQISSAALIQRLHSRNGWWRDTAQRILVHRGPDAEVIRSLKSLLNDDSDTAAAAALVRLHALCTLSELVGDDPQVVLTALADSDGTVQRHAMRVAERFLRANNSDVAAAVGKLQTSDDPHVRLQLAAVYRLLPAATATERLPNFLRAVQHQPDIFTAALTALNSENAASVLSSLLANDDAAEPLTADAAASLWKIAARLIDGPDLAKLLTDTVRSRQKLATTTDQIRQFSSLLSDVRQRAPAWHALQKFADADAAWKVLQTKLLQTARVPDRPAELRAAAIGLLVRLPVAADHRFTEQLAELLDNQQPPAIRLAAVEALLLDADQQVPTELLSSWNSRSPQQRDRILNHMLARESTTSQLLNAVQQQMVSARSLPASIRERLVNHANRRLSNQAVELFGDLSATPRQAVVAEYLPKVASIEADVRHGAVVFEKRCSACHRLQNTGRQIGADLSALKDRSTAALVTAILDPNRAVEAKFLSYSAVTTEGLSYNGMVTSETGNAVTLLQTDGRQQTIDRKQIEELICSNRSLMPEGLEKDLSAQDLADVISFVQTSGVPWKTFAGNEPHVRQPEAGGHLVLPAAAAEIYGPNLVFEDRYRNLGWWSSTDDYAVWKFDAPKSGLWTVQFEYACDTRTAGSPVKLSTGTRLLSARVPGTGTWDDYRRWTVGQIDLRQGRQQLIVSAPETPAGALIDLKTVYLLPPE